MSILCPVRLKALLLTATFLVSGMGVAAADIVRHHQDRADQHDGRHLEPPGSCLDHEHHCDLGISVGGPKLVLSASSKLAPARDMTLRVSRSDLASIESEPLFHLPPTRAPPGLR
jgi:hypothetical protein